MGGVKMPLVTVITPSYNHRSFLRDRIASICGQTLSDFEWIILDDASTDGSQELLLEASGEDSRIRLLLHDRNAGLVETMREAAEIARGSFIYRAESDDYCEPYFLEQLVNAIESGSNVGFSFCRTLSLDQSGSYWGGLGQPRENRIFKGSDLFERLLRNNFVCGGSVVIRRELFEAVGGFGVEPFRRACDWHLSLRLNLRCDAAYVAAPLAYHRIHDQNFDSSARATADVESLTLETYGIVDDVLRRSTLPLHLQERLRRRSFFVISATKTVDEYRELQRAGLRSAATSLKECAAHYAPYIKNNFAWALVRVIGSVRRRAINTARHLTRTFWRNQRR